MSVCVCVSEWVLASKIEKSEKRNLHAWLILARCQKGGRRSKNRQTDRQKHDVTSMYNTVVPRYLQVLNGNLEWLRLKMVFLREKRSNFWISFSLHEFHTSITLIFKTRENCKMFEILNLQKVYLQFSNVSLSIVEVLSNG